MKNKRLAFRRMAETKEFQNWLRMEAARITGAFDASKRYAERETKSDRIRVEVKRDGKWVLEDVE